MVKPRAADNATAAPFLEKSYEMVDDRTTDSLISWSDLGDSFVIWDMTQFSVLLLPKYFKHSNFSSFMRQLNIYGFRKVDTDRWEFANDGFVRDQKYLLKSITRRKHPHCHEPQNISDSQQSSNKSMRPINRVDYSRLLKEVENLNHGKNVLIEEFVKVRQLQETSENKLIVLRDRMQGVEKNLHKMLSFLLMAMQNPAFLVQMFNPNDNYYPMLEYEGVDNEVNLPQVLSDGRLLKYGPLLDGLSNAEFSSGLGSGKASEHNSNQTFDGTCDSFWSFDLLKMLMDETKFTLDGPILPDFPDDGSWRDLLGSPLKETNQDGKTPISPEISNTNGVHSHDFEQLMKQMGKSCGFVDNQPGVEGTDIEDDENLNLPNKEKASSISRVSTP
ncbi:hypothetical protein SAY87_026254 [Trapa incisa]|uniref:HSF-type DNA-binding domain-containing protein n=1 Tax=Trapa incisa TaxID=236973 RepID=A0AAN7JK16_9MYRT|nr:hypothetical protein SAY87_026254 [Trapa incisa]